MNEFAGAVECHRREPLVHCYRMLGSLPDAEDAVQETLLRAWRYRDSLKDGAPLRPWLYRVATNACLEFSPDVFEAFGLPSTLDAVPEKERN